MKSNIFWIIIVAIAIIPSIDDVFNSYQLDSTLNFVADLIILMVIIFVGIIEIVTGNF